MAGLRDKYCIVGIGETSYSRNSGRSTRDLGTEAVRNAMGDAGLHPWEVDGMLNYHVGDSTSSQTIATDLGIRLDFYTDTFGGGLEHRDHHRHRHRCHRGRAVPHRGPLPIDERVLRAAPGRFAGNGPARGPGGGRPDLDTAPYGDDQPGTELSADVRPPHVRVRDDQRAAGPGQGGVQQSRVQQSPGVLQERLTVDDVVDSRWIVKPACHLLDCCIETDNATCISSPRPTGPATCVSDRSRSSRWPGGSTSRSRACTAITSVIPPPGRPGTTPSGWRFAMRMLNPRTCRSRAATTPHLHPGAAFRGLWLL